MLTKLYITLWAITILAAFTIFMVGAFTPMVAVAFGFMSIGMVFMGMISVLPTAVHESLVNH